MTQLSTETNRILKRLSSFRTNIFSEDSKSEVRENIGKIRTLGERIPRDGIQNFIEALSTIFYGAIREAIESPRQMKSMDEICDFITEKFVLKGNYYKKLDELEKLEKKKCESYGDF